MVHIRRSWKSLIGRTRNIVLLLEVSLLHLIWHRTHTMWLWMWHLLWEHSLVVWAWLLPLWSDAFRSCRHRGWWRLKWDGEVACFKSISSFYSITWRCLQVSCRMRNRKGHVTSHAIHACLASFRGVLSLRLWCIVLCVFRKANGY